MKLPILDISYQWIGIIICRFSSGLFSIIVNNAAMKSARKYLSPCFQFLLSIIQDWNCGSYGNSMFNFLRNYQTLSHSTSTIYIPTSGAWGFQFLCILTNTYFLFVLWLLFVCFFLTTTILVGVKWCLIVVWNFISLMTSDVQHLFMGVEHLSCLSCIKGILIS